MEEFSKLTRQSFIMVGGKLVKGKAKGGMEIEAKKLTLLTEKPALPIPIGMDGQNTGLDKRLDYRWLDLRDPARRFPVELVSLFVMKASEYFCKNGYTEIFTPKIVGYPMEGGAEVFMMPYFNREAYLAQSPQFYKQMAICSGMEKVFEVAPVFRANPSFTTRHDTEYTSFDMEIGYIKSHHDVMDEEERMLNYVFEQMGSECKAKPKEYRNTEIALPGKMPRIKMEEAYELVSKGNVAEDGDLSPEGEREVAKYITETYQSDFVFVYDYPLKTRPFYHMIGEPMKNGAETTKSFDLLYRGVEITTGAQRQHNYEQLAINIEKKGLKLGPLDYYLELFRYGAPPHGGLGMSPTRVIKQMLNLQNVKESTFVSRDPKRLMP
jgi:aspartyl-tRNA synthetase